MSAPFRPRPRKSRSKYGVPGATPHHQADVSKDRRPLDLGGQKFDERMPWPDWWFQMRVPGTGSSLG